MYRASEKDDVPAIEKILNHDKSSLASVALSVFTNVQHRHLDFEECMSIALSEEKLLLESRIVFLGTIASVAPFLGLFGTVLGIINAFHGLSVQKQGGALVMAGISEALVATALGLFVAIPAVTAYNYFVRYIKKLLVSSENFTHFFMISYMRQKKIGLKDVRKTLQ